MGLLGCSGSCIGVRISLTHVMKDDSRPWDTSSEPLRSTAPKDIHVNYGGNREGDMTGVVSMFLFHWCGPVETWRGWSVDMKQSLFIHRKNRVTM